MISQNKKGEDFFSPFIIINIIWDVIATKIILFHFL